MAALVQALQVSLQSKDDDGTVHYGCNLDPSWAVVAVPQGGYTLGVIVQACIEHQAGSSHPDPIHVSAHFLRAASVGVGQVKAKVLKSGQTFTNILAELLQQGTTRITAHLIFGDLSPSQPRQERGTLAPPSPYARRLPLHSHPSTVSCDQGRPLWMKNIKAQVSLDTILLRQNDPTSATRTTSQSVGGGGVEWGAWCQLCHKDDKLTMSSVPLFCDIFENLPTLLPQSEPGSTREIGSWFPTITMTLEFKTKIPSSDTHSTRTVGVYSESRFLHDPQGRHNQRVEVWTAPSQIGQGEVTKDWKDDQYCIAVADQMALVVPVELNLRQRTKDSVKL